MQKIPFGKIVEIYGIDRLRKTKDLPEGSGVWFMGQLLDAPGVADGEYTLDIPISAGADAEAVENAIIEPNTPAAFNNNTYQTIHSYTVPAEADHARLHAISYDCDRFDLAQWQVTIGGTVKYTNEQVQNALITDFRGLDGKGLRLKPGDTVLIEAKSDGVNNIVCSGYIEATEAL